MLSTWSALLMRRWSWEECGITRLTLKHLSSVLTKASLNGENLSVSLLQLKTPIGYTCCSPLFCSPCLPLGPLVPCSLGPTSWWWLWSWRGPNRRPWTWCRWSPTLSWRSITWLSGWWWWWTQASSPSTPEERSNACTSETASWPISWTPYMWLTTCEDAAGQSPLHEDGTYGASFWPRLNVNELRVELWS